MMVVVTTLPLTFLSLVNLTGKRMRSIELKRFLKKSYFFKKNKNKIKKK